MPAWEVLKRYADKPERLVVGLMSGTSVDGVDAALVRIAGSGRQTQITPVAFITHPILPALREQILTLCHGGGDAPLVSKVNCALGWLFVRAVGDVLKAAKLTVTDLDAIASHGQTVSHTPHPPLRARLTDGERGATLQIGEAATLAEVFRVPVVSDFRAADVAAGGQGAPLVPYADWCLLTHPDRARAIQNIGGIGNVTYLPAHADAANVIGFDTGPGNMLMDQATLWASGNIERYDRNGRRGEQGTIRYNLLEELLDHPFLSQPPPRSAGREEFGASFFAQLVGTHRLDTHRNRNDVIATLTAFTALSIVDAYERFLPRLPDEVIVGGGGARNLFLMRLLRERLAPAPVLTHEDVGLSSDSKEAVAFALLANETLLGYSSNLPSVTGASRAVIQGKLTFP